MAPEFIPRFCFVKLNNVKRRMAGEDLVRSTCGCPEVHAFGRRTPLKSLEAGNIESPTGFR